MVHAALSILLLQTRPSNSTDASVPPCRNLISSGPNTLELYATQ